MTIMQVIARIEPGELYQRGKKNGLSFEAATKLDQLEFVVLEIDFNQAGQIGRIKVKETSPGELPQGARKGWPFRSAESSW